MGCIVVGGLAGGAVTYFSAGAAVPTGVTVAASVGGCLVGGATAGFATDMALNNYDAVADNVDTAMAAISDLFNDASGTENLQNPLPLMLILLMQHYWISYSPAYRPKLNLWYSSKAIVTCLIVSLMKFLSIADCQR